RRSLIVRVNDRGPYHANRVIDVSARAAQLLGFDRKGVARVKVEYVGRAKLEGSDDRRLAATLREGSPAPAPSTVMVASARPFIPGLAGADPAWAAPPLPPERPFELGRPGPAPRASGFRPQTAAPGPAVAGLRGTTMRPTSTVEPMTAYAPVDSAS